MAGPMSSEAITFSLFHSLALLLLPHPSISAAQKSALLSYPLLMLFCSAENNSLMSYPLGDCIGSIRSKFLGLIYQESPRIGEFCLHEKITSFRIWLQICNSDSTGPKLREESQSRGKYLRFLLTLFQLINYIVP